MQEPTSTQFSEPDDTKKQTAPAGPAAPVDHTHLGDKINKNFMQRTRWTILMLLGFVLVIASGQLGCCLLVLAANFLIFKEINSIKRDYEKQANIPITKFINWYFYLLANFYCFGHFLSTAFPRLADPALIANHAFICYCGFIAGFVGFVLSLKQGYLKYQFRVFAWIALATIMVVFQSWLIMANIMEGLIWFVLPALLIVCNDIFAYLVGYFFGSHQLIALSPKKTWQGYIGGALFTCLFSYILTSTLVTIPGFTCPARSLGDLVPFAYPGCSDNHITDQFATGVLPFRFMVGHFHVFVLSVFASVVGPFGGFFASGLKRSIKIKDFSNLIPGHGGLSDRMDCQMIMGSFTYFYIQTFLVVKLFDPALILDRLSNQQQMVLYQELKARVHQLIV